jgi:hypothetical protein
LFMAPLGGSSRLKGFTARVNIQSTQNLHD